MNFSLILFEFLIINNFYKDLINNGIIIPIVGAIVGTIVGILIKYIYSKLKKKKDTNLDYKQHRKGRKWSA